MDVLEVAQRIQSEQAVVGTVDDMLRENLPGIEGHSREELEAVVRAVHTEAIELFRKGELTPKDAPRWEWRRIMEVLRK